MKVEGLRSITIRMPDALYDELTEAARERTLSRNTLLVAAIKEFLPRLIPLEEWKFTR